MPRLPPRKICSRCGFSKEESESLCERCRNGQEPYLTYIRTSSRCAKCGGVKNDVKQICEYCHNAQELPKIIRPLRSRVPLHEQSLGYYQRSSEDSRKIQGKARLEEWDLPPRFSNIRLWRHVFSSNYF
jgi:hypothetical protein